MSVNRGYQLNMVRWHKLPVDEKDAMRGDVLKKVMEDDRKKGLIPFMVSLLCNEILYK